MWPGRNSGLGKIIHFANLTTLIIGDACVFTGHVTALINGAKHLERLISLGMRCTPAPDVGEVQKLFQTVASKNLSSLKIKAEAFSFLPQLKELLNECGRHSRLKDLSLVGLNSCRMQLSNEILVVITDKLSRLKRLTLDLSKECHTPVLVRLIQNLNDLEGTCNFQRIAPVLWSTRNYKQSWPIRPVYNPCG